MMYAVVAEYYDTENNINRFRGYVIKSIHDDEYEALEEMSRLNIEKQDQRSLPIVGMSVYYECKAVG